ncbi:hypothetical protein [Paracoccus fistulariae]|uniref:Uncharacterized protein n=1 Tax=Paracoccus fistulariae TaxID=658446 RepID=A0ABY7SMN6_9RHOB|nr:hypothetical protein [Paracoccus fistulariae]MDB6180090.1 hypothetical protein [Paracoccus fistulariae]WCR08178.1 hypothetical protein JHX87_05015 [Paracoccus fistulariae]
MTSFHFFADRQERTELLHALNPSKADWSSACTQVFGFGWRFAANCGRRHCPGPMFTPVCIRELKLLPDAR